MTEPEETGPAKVRRGTATMVQGMRGLRHGWERLQEGARTIAEVEPTAVRQAMETAAALAPIMEQVSRMIELGELALRKLDAEQQPEDDSTDVDSGSGAP